MAMDARAPTSPIELTARLVASATGETVLHLSYDGTEPPLSALGELRRAGWADAVPSPPPASAIDWTRPDEAAGRRYSLHPYPATTTARFRGTRDQRSAAAAHAREVLTRAGFAGDPGREPAQEPVVAATTMAAPEPAGGTRAVVEVVVVEPNAALARTRVRSWGEVMEEHAETRVTEVTYRGNRSETFTPVVRLCVEVDERRADDAVRDLSTAGVVEVRIR